MSTNDSPVLPQVPSKAEGFPLLAPGGLTAPVDVFAPQPAPQPASQPATRN